MNPYEPSGADESQLDRIERRFELHQGDCLDVLKTLADCSVDAIVTDPPYGLSFMGKRWDYDVPSVDIWAECLRVLKPGGHLLAFAGTRTQHRMAVRIEDAGFEIRDMIAWVYGSGFPKSLDISKAIDKAAGHWRGKAGEVVSDNGAMSGGNYRGNPKGDPVTGEATTWDGFGTALKPALEPITLARKPLIGTVAANVLEHGTGGLNIDGCRVEGKPPSVPQPSLGVRERITYGFGTGEGRNGEMSEASGRFPANLILTYPEDLYKLRDNVSLEQSKQLLDWMHENPKH
jgi:site-specific DNA-methyltransferase (adenine-specific)